MVMCWNFSAYATAKSLTNKDTRARVARSLCKVEAGNWRSPSVSIAQAKPRHRLDTTSVEAVRCKSVLFCSKDSDVLFLKPGFDCGKVHPTKRSSMARQLFLLFGAGLSTNKIRCRWGFPLLRSSSCFSLGSWGPRLSSRERSMGLGSMGVPLSAKSVSGRWRAMTTRTLRSQSPGGKCCTELTIRSADPIDPRAIDPVRSGGRVGGSGRVGFESKAISAGDRA